MAHYFLYPRQEFAPLLAQFDPFHSSLRDFQLGTVHLYARRMRISLDSEQGLFLHVDININIMGVNFNIYVVFLLPAAYTADKIMITAKYIVCGMTHGFIPKLGTAVAISTYLIALMRRMIKLISMIVFS